MCYLLVCKAEERPCVSVLNCTDCALRAHSVLGEGQLEHSTHRSVLVPACVTVPSLQHTQSKRVSCTVGSLPTAREMEKQKKQHQGRSEKS